MAYERTSGLGFCTEFRGAEAHTTCAGALPHTYCVTPDSTELAVRGGCRRQPGAACSYQVPDGATRQGFIHCCPPEWAARVFDEVPPEEATAQTKVARADWDADWIALDLEATKVTMQELRWRALRPWIWGGAAVAGVGLIGLLGWAAVGRK